MIQITGLSYRPASLAIARYFQETGGMERTPQDVGHLFRARRNSKGADQRDFGVSTATIRKIEKGDVSPKTRSTAPYAVELGWPADAWQRLLDGADPATLVTVDDTNSSRNPTNADLRDLLGVGGQVVQDQLDEIKARLERLESADTVVGLDAERPPKATSERRKTRERAERPTTRPIEGAYAASREDGQPDDDRPTGETVHRASPPDDGPDPTQFND